jgi:hypothetical protein
MLTAWCNEARLIILRDEIVQVVVGLKDDAAAAPAVAAARPALGHEGFAMKRDAAFAAVPRFRVNFYFVNEHVPAFFQPQRSAKYTKESFSRSLCLLAAIPKMKKARREPRFGNCSRRI